MTHFYEVAVNWEAGKKGLLVAPSLNDSIEVVTPPEFSGGISGKWSPEHLFVAAVNSCLMTTFLAIAENSRLEFSSFTSSAVGKLEKIEGKLLMSEVVLSPKVTIAAKELREKTLKILEKAERACLISNSITSKIIMKPEIIVA
jgi:peroxiredoxin-like protein